MIIRGQHEPILHCVDAVGTLRNRQNVRGLHDPKLKPGNGTPISISSPDRMPTIGRSCIRCNLPNHSLPLFGHRFEFLKLWLVLLGDSFKQFQGLGIATGLVKFLTMKCIKEQMVGTNALCNLIITLSIKGETVFERSAYYSYINLNGR